MFSEPRLAHDLTLPSPLFLAGMPLFEADDALPQMPILAATRLQLELLLQERSVDLKNMAEIILADAGATLQVLRLIGEEYPAKRSGPTRIEDCIVSLNRERWYEVVCAAGISHSAPLLAEWQHCRRIAECARELGKMHGRISARAGLSRRPALSPGQVSAATWLEAGRRSCACEPRRCSPGRGPRSQSHARRVLAPARIPALRASGQAPAAQLKQDSVAGWAGILQGAHELAERAQASCSGSGL